MNAKPLTKAEEQQVRNNLREMPKWYVRSANTFVESATVYIRLTEKAAVDKDAHDMTAVAMSIAGWPVVCEHLFATLDAERASHAATLAREAMLRSALVMLRKARAGELYDFIGDPTKPVDAALSSSPDALVRVIRTLSKWRACRGGRMEQAIENALQDDFDALPADVRALFQEGK